MNNKKNEKKSLQNAKTFMTYLALNKKRFLPRPASINLYLNHKTIANELNWSPRKVYNIFDDCVKRKLIEIISHKHFVSKYARIFHINPFTVNDYLDQALVDNEVAKFVKLKTNNAIDKKPDTILRIKKPNNDIEFLSHYFNHPFFTTMKYEKKCFSSFKNIDHYFDMYVAAKLANENNTIEYKIPVFNDLVQKINSTNRSECEYVYFNDKITLSKTPKKYRIKKSCRAYSRLCNSSKIYLRSDIMKLLKLPNEYDISATVPAVFRLLNYNIFDPDQNIRQMIINDSNLKNI